MWKLAFLGSCLLFCISEAPVPGGGERYCDKNQDCREKECCISFATPRSAGQQFGRGKCEKHGTSGSECLIRVSDTPANIYYHSCPCCDSHTCKGTDNWIPPLGELGTCEKKCSSCADCRPSECCVIDSRRKGKRSADRVKRQTQGTCKPMGRRGSECLVTNGSGKPHKAVFHSCPCKNPLTCIGTGVRELPLGELGKCENY